MSYKQIRSGHLLPLGLLAFVLCFAPAWTHAQFTAPQASTGQLRNLATLKPPPNAKVAIVVVQTGATPDEARQRLARAGGFLRRALSDDKD